MIYLMSACEQDKALVMYENLMTACEQDKACIFRAEPIAPLRARPLIRAEPASLGGATPKRNPYLTAEVPTKVTVAFSVAVYTRIEVVVDVVAMMVAIFQTHVFSPVVREVVTDAVCV